MNCYDYRDKYILIVYDEEGFWLLLHPLRSRPKQDEINHLVMEAETRQERKAECYALYERIEEGECNAL